MTVSRERLVRLRRRDALKQLATAAGGGAIVPALALEARAQVQAQSAPALTQAAPPSAAADAPRPPGDPDLLQPVVWWKKVLTAGEMKTVAALADTILPADGRSPAASRVGVPEFINEWVSAPYPAQQEDLALVRGGLAWLGRECVRRFGKRFEDLGTGERQQICDAICHKPAARPRDKAGALFFDRMRWLCLTGFYTTPEGMKDIGYVGNVPSAQFDGPPPAVRRHLKLDS